RGRRARRGPLAPGPARVVPRRAGRGRPGPALKLSDRGVGEPEAQVEQRVDVGLVVRHQCGEAGAGGLHPGAERGDLVVDRLEPVAGVDFRTNDLGERAVVRGTGHAGGFPAPTGRKPAIRSNVDVQSAAIHTVLALTKDFGPYSASSRP